jgi:hypothetical protein
MPAPGWVPNRFRRNDIRAYRPRPLASPSLRRSSGAFFRILAKNIEILRKCCLGGARPRRRAAVPPILTFPRLGGKGSSDTPSERGPTVCGSILT